MNLRPGAAHSAAPRRNHSRGMVTIELAVGLVTATLLAATLSGVVLLGVAQASCARTSSEMARQLARGDEAAARSAEAAAPKGATSRVDTGPGGIDVRVTAPVDLFGIGPINVSARSWAAWEPGVGDAAPG